MLLEPEAQQELIDSLTDSFNAILAQKEAMGENALEAKVLDLQAEPVSSVEIKPATGTSPFQAAALLETMKIKAPGRAMKPAEVVAKVAKSWFSRSRPTRSPAILSNSATSASATPKR